MWQILIPAITSILDKILPDPKAAAEAKMKMPVRPMMDRFIDDPRELHKGEVTRFQTGPATKESPRLRGDRSVSPRVTDPSPT